MGVAKKSLETKKHTEAREWVVYVQPAHIIPVMWGWALQPRPRPSHDCKILASLCIELQAFKLYTQSHSYLLGIFSHKKCSRTLQGQISKNRHPGTKTVSYLFYTIKHCTVFCFFATVGCCWKISSRPQTHLGGERIIFILAFIPMPTTVAIIQKTNICYLPSGFTSHFLSLCNICIFKLT